MGKDEICYHHRKIVGLDLVMYKVIEGMWYLDPNRSMSDGLHRIRNDSDVENGFMVAIGDDMKMTIFMIGHYVVDYEVDNEEGTIRPHVNLVSVFS
ncbi:hypothetical protein LINPERHAP1_LOCUS39591 [Linum perenne]